MADGLPGRHFANEIAPRLIGMAVRAKSLAAFFCLFMSAPTNPPRIKRSRAMRCRHPLCLASLVLAGRTFGASSSAVMQDSPTQKEQAFDVASVKYIGPRAIQTGPGRGMVIGEQPFRYSGQRLTFKLALLSILEEAYGLEEWQIVAPDWLNEELYQVDAIMPANATQHDSRVMVRTLLTERFGL